MKSASQRSTKHHTSTPYDRPKPKGFVQTVKDWLTPSKWTKEVVSPLPNRTISDHTPWPGTPHPIQGRQLDVRGVTHPLTPPSFNEFNEEMTEMKKNESSVLVSNKEEVMEESSARSGSNTPLANTSVPPPFIAQNGLDPPPPITCPSATYSTGSHPLRGGRVKQKEKDVPLSSPYVSPPPGPLRTSEVGHTTPKSTVSSASSRGHPSFSLSAFNSPVNTAALTNLSLSRSPFTSSFYTGRTSYGGASSSGRPSSSSLFRKRTRNETSPTSVQVRPVKRAVKPHPHTSQFPVGGASHTALKILDTLQSLSTPLQDARKLPLRATPAKKQRIEGPSTSSSATSPPPPVSSLSAPPTHAKLSKVRQPVVHVVASPPTPPPSRGKEKVVIDLTISPKEVKRTQAPPPTPPPSSSKSSTGKIRATKHTSHYSSKNREGEEEDVYNTSELPPPIPLLLHKSGPLPSIDIPFLTPLTKVPTTTSNLTRSPLSSMMTASSYSFTSPEMALRSESCPHATPISPINSDLFQFSDPLPILVGSTSSGAIRPPLAASGSLSFKAQPVSLAPPSSVSPTLPTLSKPAGSLVDALKKPEYQIENIRKEAKQKSVLPPSITTPPVVGESKGLSVPPLKPLKDVPLIVPTSNWSCDSCWVSNKSDTNKCVACGASQPSGIKKKAVAFSTPSVTDTSSGGLKLPSGGSLISTSGGLKLPTGGSLSTTSGGLKLPTGGSLTTTSGGLKLPTGGSLTSTSGELKLPTGNLTGGVKLPQGGNVMLAPSSGIFSSSGPPPSTSTSTSIASSSGSGFKLSSGGLSGNLQLPTLITPATTKPATPLSSLAPPASNWECPVCMISNAKDADTCVACGAKRSSGTSNDSKGSVTGSLKPGGKWECPTCMLHNDPTKDSCPACETPRPGAAAKTSQTGLSVKPVQFGDGGGMKLGGGGGLLLTGVGNKPTLPIASGGGLKLGGGGLNIFGGISSQSQSVSTSNTSTSQSVTFGVTTQSTITTSSHTNVSVSSLISSNVPTGSSLLSSSSLSTAPSLLPTAATKPLFGQSLPTIAPSPLSTASTAPTPLSLGGSVSLSSNLTSTVGAPLFMQSQQPVSGPGTTFTLPKSDFNKGALSGLKFEAPPPPVLTTASSEGKSQSQPISVAPSSGFSTLPTTSVGASLFQSFLTPPPSAPVSTATMFGKPPGGGDGQKLLFGVPSQGSAPVSKVPAPPSLFPPIIGTGMSSGGMGNTGMKTGGMEMSGAGMNSGGIRMSSGGTGMSSGGTGMSSGGIGMSSGGMGMSSGGMGMSGAGMNSGGIRINPGGTGMSSGGMGMSGAGMNTGGIGMSSGGTGIGMSSGGTGIGMTSGGTGIGMTSGGTGIGMTSGGTGIGMTSGGTGIGMSSSGMSTNLFGNPNPGGQTSTTSGFNFNMKPNLNFGNSSPSPLTFQFGSNQQQQHPLQQGQNVFQPQQQPLSLKQGLQQQQQPLQQGLQQQQQPLQQVLQQQQQPLQQVLQQQQQPLAQGLQQQSVSFGGVGSSGIGMGGGGFSVGSDSARGKRPIKKAVRRHHKLN